MNGHAECDGEKENSCKVNGTAGQPHGGRNGAAWGLKGWFGSQENTKSMSGSRK